MRRRARGKEAATCGDGGATATATGDEGDRRGDGDSAARDGDDRCLPRSTNVLAPLQRTLLSARARAQSPFSRKPSWRQAATATSGDGERRRQRRGTATGDQRRCLEERRALASLSKQKHPSLLLRPTTIALLLSHSPASGSSPNHRDTHHTRPTRTGSRSSEPPSPLSRSSLISCGGARARRPDSSDAWRRGRGSKGRPTMTTSSNCC
jgi:hypothetical protein